MRQEVGEKKDRGDRNSVVKKLVGTKTRMVVSARAVGRRVENGGNSVEKRSVDP